MLSMPPKKPDAAAARRDRRLRAMYRRELQTNVYLACWIVACGIATSIVATCLLQPTATPLIVAAGVPMVAVAAVVGRNIRRAWRKHVVALGMLVALLPILSTASSISVAPQWEDAAVACIGLMLLAFAVFIPLERKPHVIWLVAADCDLVGIAILMEATNLDPAHPSALVVAAALATVFSLAANELQLRRRYATSEQLLGVRRLYARMKEHELDLHRQDDFLLMQQETLVVQQAELLRLNEELETIARLDALTGLGNRLRLNEDLAQLAARIERTGGTAGLLLMDLDHFKRLNDTAGHLAGDAALRGLAEVLRQTSRVGDGLYRYGGEEFLVILHDADQSVLATTGQRYLTAIEAAAMPHPSNTPYGVVTASGGITELSPANCSDIDISLRNADEALYVAKESGRNRLIVHVPEGAPDLLALERRRAAS